MSPTTRPPCTASAGTPYSEFLLIHGVSVRFDAEPRLKPRLSPLGPQSRDSRRSSSRFPNPKFVMLSDISLRADSEDSEVVSFSNVEPEDSEELHLEEESRRLKKKRSKKSL